MPRRNSFVFYRSFLDAISCLAVKDQAEIYPAIARYALDRKMPDNLSGAAMAVFLIAKPIIDTNATKAKAGRKGAAYGKLGGRPRKNDNTEPENVIAKDAGHEPKTVPTPHPDPAATLTLQHEVSQMKADRTWGEPVCMQFHVSPEELAKRLDTFLTHCKCENDAKPHKNLADAKRHFCSWMRKAYPPPKDGRQTLNEKPSYDFNGGFGGQDT